MIVGQYIKATGAAQCESVDKTQTRADLEVEPGVHIHGPNAQLTVIAGRTAGANYLLRGSGASWVVTQGASARSDLGLVIGSAVQAYNANLLAIANLLHSDGAIIVSSGGTWVAKTPSQARSALSIQAQSVELDEIAALSPAAGSIMYNDVVAGWQALAPPAQLSWLYFNGTYTRPAWTTTYGSGDMTVAGYDADADGKVDMAAGGLETDVSAYNGALKVATGSLSEAGLDQSGGLLSYTARLAQLSGGTKPTLSDPDTLGIPWTWAEDWDTTSFGNDGLRPWLVELVAALASARV